MTPYNNVEDRKFWDARLYNAEDPLAGVVGDGWAHYHSDERGVQVYLGAYYG